MDDMSMATEAIAPEFEVGPLDLGATIVSYDRESDTLMLHLFGRGRPGISVVVGDYLYLRMDRERKQVFGFQIEGFLSHVVRRRPELLDALDVAELRGITLEEVATLQRQMATEQRKRAAVGQVISQCPQISPINVGAD